MKRKGDIKWLGLLSVLIGYMLTKYILKQSIAQEDFGLVVASLPALLGLTGLWMDNRFKTDERIRNRLQRLRNRNTGSSCNSSP